LSEACFVGFKQIRSIVLCIRTYELKNIFAFFAYIVHHLMLFFILNFQLEQMELEVREVEASARPRLRTRVDSYRAELGRLSQEFMKVRSPPFQDGMYLFCHLDLKV